jgi:hypothetical protein
LEAARGTLLLRHASYHVRKVLAVQGPRTRERCANARHRRVLT